MIPTAVLGRYAKSLAEVVFEENLEQEVTADLEAYDGIFRAVPDLLVAFDNPAVPRDSKEKILMELTARYPVHTMASNFLRILLRHNRLLYFPQIYRSYLEAVNERKGVVSATVSTAFPLSQQEVNGIAEKLGGITGKRVNIETKTDESLLGGVVVRMGSTVFDGSIRTQLQSVKRRLLET